jgi:hypothetical protein
MKPRDRVQIALNHEKPDRCPMQISFTPEFAERLRADMKIQGHQVHNPHGGGNTYELERALGEDMLLTSVGWANSYYMGDQAYIDEWGVGWDIKAYQTPFGTGHYTEMVKHPLAEDATISSYKPPDPNRAELYTASAQVIADFKEQYWIVGVTVTTILETAWALRGLEQLLLDMIEIGLDVLNPIQPASMDPGQIKKQFGDKLCFWGSIDEQKTLPFGTAKEVEAEVLLRLETIGKNGGLILAPTHHVQLDTPLENFWAMVDTITGTPYNELD